jgi:hypothetical protein
LFLNIPVGLAEGSSRGVHRVVADSDHYIQFSQPDAVITAIREVIAAAGTSLPK